MRKLTDVIDRLLTEIPVSAPLHKELKRINDSASYASPENQLMWWQEAAKAMSTHLGNPKDLVGADLKVFNIWMGDA